MKETRTTVYLFFVSLALLAAGCSEKGALQQGQDEMAPVSKIIGNRSSALNGSILVYLDEGTADALYSAPGTKSSDGGTACDLEDVFPGTGIESAEPVFRIDRNDMDASDMKLSRWFKLTFDESLDPSAVAESLSGVSCVQKVQFNARIRNDVETEVYEYVPSMRIAPDAVQSSDPVFDDPGLPDQWHYDNDGTVCRAAMEGEDINVSSAWRLTAGDPGIIVAVIDDAVWYEHPDLAGNMWVNEAELNGTPGVDDDGNGYVDDIYGYNFVGNGGEIIWDGPNQLGHGTHVAGTVAAVNNNGTGVCGVAGGTGNGDGVRIMACQVLQGEQFADIPQVAEAINYARKMGAVILQCSFGFTSGDVKNDNDFASVAGVEKDALDAFMTDNHNFPNLDGGLVFFSAGNEYGKSTSYPGAYTECISVSAVASDGLPALYTSMGYGTNIAAPGGESGTGGYDTPEACVLSTVPPNISSSMYGYMQGTSMACPHASGVAALGLAYAKKLGKTYTRDEFVSMILTSVNDLDEKLLGKKLSKYVTLSGPKVMSMSLSQYQNMMGTGTIDAWRLLMQIEGTPCITAAVGTEQSISVSEYFGGASSNFTYLGVEMSGEDMDALGLETKPRMENGMLVINPSKYGSAKLTVRAVGGGEYLGGGVMVGGMEISKEISIVTRGVAASNNGWL